MTVDDIIAVAGGIRELAAITGADRTTVYGWQRHGRIPIERARSIETALGIPLHKIRPDVWSPPQQRERVSA